MPKFIKNRYEDEVKPNQSKVSNIIEAKFKKKIKNNLKLYECKSCLCCNQNHIGTCKIKKKKSISNVNKKFEVYKFTRNKAKDMAQKVLPTRNIELSTQKLVASTSRQNESNMEAEWNRAFHITENKSNGECSYVKPLNIIDTNYDTALNEIAQPIKCTTIPHCDTTFVSCTECSNTFSCHKELAYHKEVHHIIYTQIPVQLKQNRLRTRKKKYNRLVKKGEKQQVIQGTCKEKIFDYLPGERNSEETLNNVSMPNTIQAVVAKQKDIVTIAKKSYSNFLMIQKSQKIMQKNECISNSQLNTKIYEKSKKKYKNTGKSHNTELHNKDQFSSVKSVNEFTSCKSCFDNENQMVLPNLYNKKFIHDATLQKAMYKNQEENTLVSTNKRRKIDNLEEEHFTNSSKRRLKAKSIVRPKQCKESQKNVACNTFTGDTSKIKSLESKNNEINASNKYSRSISNFPSDDCNKIEKLNETAVSQVSHIQHETMLEHNVQMATHFCSKTTFYDKRLEQGQKENSLLNTVSQNLHNSLSKHTRRSSRLRIKKNCSQTILQSNPKNTSNISMTCGKHNEYKFRNFSEINESEKTTRDNVGEEKNARLRYHLRNLNTKKLHEICTTIKKYKKSDITNVQSNDSKKKFRKESTFNSSVTTNTPRKNTKIHKINVTTNNNLMKANYIGSRKMVVPLVKLEDLSLSDLSQLLMNPRFIENKINCKKEHIKEARHSIHKQSFKHKTITVNKSIETNLENKNVKSCVIQKKNHMCQKTIEKTDIINTDSECNVLKVTNMEHCSVTTSNISFRGTNINGESKEYPITSNIQRNETHTKCEKSCEHSLYVCSICSKQYKRKHGYLSHILKHKNTCVHIQQKIQEDSKYQNVVKFDNTEHTKNYPNNNKNHGKLRITATNMYLKQKCETPPVKTVNNDMSNAENKNKESITEKNISLQINNMCSSNYILNINTAEKFEAVVNRQKLLKLSINVRKVYTISDNGQQIRDNEMDDKFRINCTTDSNITSQTNEDKTITFTKKEMYCYICGKKFNSERMLKEHVFFLHDSILEDSNLHMTYMTNCQESKTLFNENIDQSQKKCSIRSNEKITKLGTEDNKINEKTVNIYSENKMYIKRCRKWRCNICKENFALIRNYLRHRYYCHNDESIVHICDNCNKILTSVAMVNVHMCTNVTSWNCKRCNLNFNNGISLTQHNRDCHFETLGPYTCNICELTFLTMHMLQRHKSTHLINNTNSNINHSTDVPISVDNNLSHNVNNINNLNIELSKLSISNKRVNTCDNTSSVIFLPYDDEEVLKCKLCHIICLTKLQMKLHLERWHDIKIEMCQLCNDLCVLDELVEHLLNHHMVMDTLSLNHNINIQAEQKVVINSQNDLVKILGLKRFKSLYEYQRYDNVVERKCFNCITCSKEFSNIHHYKIHYLQFHDIICLLCNIEFKHSLQAFEHKVKIHISVNSYLWTVQKLIATILESNKYGNNIEDIILQFSKKGICNNETYLYNKKEHDSVENIQITTSQSSQWEDYKHKSEDTSKKRLYEIGAFKNLVESPVIDNTNIRIADSDFNPVNKT